MGSQQSRPSSTHTRRSSIRSSNGSFRSRRSLKLKQQQQQQQQQQQILPQSLQQQRKDLSATATEATTLEALSKKQPQQSQPPSQQQKQQQQFDSPSPLGHHLQPQYQRPPRHRSRQSSPTPRSRSPISRSYSVLSSSSSSMSSMVWSGGLFSQLEATCSNITTITDFSSRFSSKVNFQPKAPWPKRASSIPNSDKRSVLTASEILAQLEAHPTDAYNIFKLAFSPNNKTEFFQAASAWVKQHPESNIAAVWVARCLLDGWGVSANPASALSQLKDLATTKGAWEAYYPLAEYYQDNNALQDAIYWYTQAAESNHKETVGAAQCRLGELSEPFEGLVWFKKSAENGNKCGQYMTAIHYQYGIGVTKDLALAQRYFLASAEQENPEAQCALGILFFEAQEPTQGRIWLDRAAKQNNDRALLYLGEYYEKQGLYEQAVEFYKTAATAADNAKAQYYIGRHYRFGSMGLTKDYKEAVRYLRRSVRHDYVPAQRLLGQMYAQGLVGNAKDNRMALTLFRRAASQGDVFAMCMVGTSYEESNQYDLALEQYRRVAQIDSPFRAVAQLCTGLLLFKMERTHDAYDWFKKAASVADNGGHDGLASQKAQLVLARYLLHGWAPVACDPGAGFQALQALAATCDTAAAGGVYYWLGACYEEGLPGVCEPDQAMAFDCYLKAAEAGHMDSAFQVAFILADQRHDHAGAFPWYQKAAAQGHRVAQYTAGLYYAKGLAGVATNVKKALELFESSAVQGFVPAMTSIGMLCRKYCKLSNNNQSKHHHKLQDQMVYWFQKAADAGDVVAQRYLGFLFHYGTGVKQSYETAFGLLTKASQQNDVRATLLLGSCYEQSKGTEADLEKALELYDKAAELGDSTAFYAAALVLQKQGEYDKAYEKYKQAAEDPSLADSKTGKNSKMMLARYILGYYYVDTAATTSAGSSTTATATTLEGSNAPLVQKEQQRSVSLTDLHGLIVQDGFRLLFELATVQEFPDSYFWLGNCYYDGLGAASDYGKALEWYLLAIDKTNSAEALMKVAVMHELGQGTPANMVEALKYYHRAADEDHPEAQHKLGMAYWRGLYNVPISLDEAVLWFTRSASRYPASCWALGRMALENGDQDVAIKWWRKANDAGHTPSMREITSLLLQSSTSAAAAINEDDDSPATATAADDTVEQAMNLLASAVQSHDPEALVMLGKHYQQQSTAAQQQPLNDDIGEHEAEQLMQHRSKHQDLSIRCFEQAAEMGHVEAMFLAAQSWHSQEQFAAALDHYDSAAKQGHALSRVMRARYWIAGYGGVEADPEAGYKELLLCAHDDGCVDAYNSLGQCHELGLGTTQDDRLALEWYLRSAEATQDAEAMFRIGQMHACGRVPSSPDASGSKDYEALQWYRFACDSRNHPRAHYYVGLYYVHGIQDDATGETLLAPDLIAAKNHFRQAAVQEDRDAMHELGQLLLFTETTTTTTPENLQQQQQQHLARAEGLEWLERAAQLGCVAAQCELGKLYHTGTEDGIACQDFGKAYDYFCRAAQQGDDKTAALFIGNYYEHGIHVSPNLEMARHWYSLAAENGWWLAELALARLFHQHHTPETQTEAYRLFKAAKQHAGTASQDNATATASLTATLMVALYELNGWAGVQARPEAAAQTLLDLAVQGETQAFLAVARCYETGHGLPEDKTKAFEWYGRIVTRQQSEEEGDENEVAEAMFRLGRFYEHGWDVVTVDRAKATDLYTLAAEHGCEEARSVLLHQQMS